jgi:membrane dipeptidase
MSVDHERIEAATRRLRFINASDLTGIASGMPYRARFGPEYIRRLREGGVTALHASLAVWFYDTFPAAMKRFGAVLRFLREHEGDLALVRTVEDIVKAEAEGRIGVILHFHSASPLDDDLGLLEVYARSGLRVMQLTYQGRNLVGDGCAEVNPGGLSSFGIRVVEEMNRLGILVDVAHAGPRTFADALEVSRAPVLNSHGCVRALRDHPRNLTDQQIRALADRGGVFGIMAKSDCLAAHGATEGTTLDDYLEHVVHVARLVGVDHVAIGLENGFGVDDTDLQGLLADVKLRSHRPYEQGRVPKDYDFEKFYSAKGVEDIGRAKRNLVGGLLSRGFSEDDIAKILGGNLLRLYGKVWTP